MTFPVLVVVAGPAGTGKTTLAHLIAREVGCPAICRDEIKEGMVHATPEVARHELSLRALPVFFEMLELLLRAGVTTVAEAAFQDRLWRPGLERLHGLSRIRIVHCTVDTEIALTRRLRRWENEPLRQAHEDVRPMAPQHDAFDRVSVAAPWIEVDTTAGYRPGLDDIVAFVNQPG